MMRPDNTALAVARNEGRHWGLQRAVIRIRARLITDTQNFKVHGLEGSQKGATSAILHRHNHKH